MRVLQEICLYSAALVGIAGLVFLFVLLAGAVDQQTKEFFEELRIQKFFNKIEEFRSDFESQ